MKKILSVCLALVLLLTCISMQTFAEGAPAFSAGSAEANPGDTVEIPILIENNPGIVALSVSVSFDRNVLTLQNASSDGSVFPAAGITFGGTYDTDTFNILWEDGTSTVNNTSSGLIATLTFLVSEDAPVGETVVSVGYASSSVVDVNLNDVAFETVNGVVTVVPAEVGGWSFTDDSSLYIVPSESEDILFICGLDVYDPVISPYIETTGGWSYEIENNDYGMESTGAKLVILDENDNPVEEYYTVMFGDINGDGVYDLSDVSLMSDAMAGAVDDVWGDFIIPDKYPQSFAADCYHDLTLDLTDMSILFDHLTNVELVDQEIWF